MSKFIEYYMKNSKNRVALSVYLGILELVNNPSKLWKIIVVIAIYISGMLYRDRLEIPFIPESVYPLVDKAECIVLSFLLIILSLALISKTGRDLFEKENRDMRVALAKVDKDNIGYIQLVYKRKIKGNIVRKIYSKTKAKDWCRSEVKEDIRKLFAEHFERGTCIYDDPRCPSLTIMITKEGYKKETDTGEKYRDDELNREMAEIE